MLHHYSFRTQINNKSQSMRPLKKKKFIELAIIDLQNHTRSLRAQTFIEV